ncbi:MAG: Phosphoglycolate phosphatase [Paracidovorax wautersii]|uniref:phosphoglycolate phosphatase n=1 Tax=Paracidovorax wautersii TaxID=1177982 RepID=A0A7V8FKH0_9BURK|nr:MAG: Phosphoglycolate phosphatase [Paracidovorax wautersii]
MTALKLAPQALRAVAIDLDGTLIDTLGDFHAALAAMLHDLALPAVLRETVAGFIGKGTEHLLRSVLAHVAPQAGLSASGQAAAYTAGWDRYMHHYGLLNGEHAQVYAGVVDGLAASFVHVAGGDTYPHKKPHPQPLLETARALGAEPAAMLMVGDSVNDAQAARAAGCPVVLVPYGYSHGIAVDTLDTDGIVPNLAALAQALRGQP